VLNIKYLIFNIYYWDFYVIQKKYKEQQEEQQQKQQEEQQQKQQEESVDCIGSFDDWSECNIEKCDILNNINGIGKKLENI
jgi:hypothetical protein